MHDDRMEPALSEQNVGPAGFEPLDADQKNQDQAPERTASDPTATDGTAPEPAAPDATAPDPIAPDPAAPGATASDPTTTDGTAPEAAVTESPGEPTQPRPWWQRGGRPPRRDHKGRRKAPWWELPLLVAVAIGVAILIKTFVVQPFYIPSESMEKTLHGCAGCSGDRVLVNKVILDLRHPHPGDIVVFKSPAGWDDEPHPSPPHNPILRGFHWFGQLVGVVPPDEKDLIKRVIATGGQTVQCCDSQGRVQVSNNGPGGPFRSLDEPYIFENSPWNPKSTPGHVQAGDARTFGPVTVPKGRIWVMGDHRGDSADSRFHCNSGGPNDRCDPQSSTVPTNDVIGKAVIIAWPPSRWRTLGTPSTFKHTALASAGVTQGALPLLGAAAMTLPVGVLRRRRRRR